MAKMSLWFGKLKENIPYWRTDLKKLRYKSVEHDKRLNELDTRVTLSREEFEAKLAEVREDVKNQINLENPKKIYDSLMQVASERPEIQRIIDEAKVASDLTRMSAYVLSHPDAQKALEEIYKQAGKTARTKRRSIIASSFAVGAAALVIAGAYVSSKIYDRKYVGNTLDNIEQRVSTSLTNTTSRLEKELARLDTTKTDARDFQAYAIQDTKELTRATEEMKLYAEGKSEEIRKQIETVQVTYTPAIANLERIIGEQAQSNSTNFVAINEKIDEQKNTMTKYGQDIEESSKQIGYLRDKTSYLLQENSKSKDPLSVPGIDRE